MSHVMTWLINLLMFLCFNELYENLKKLNNKILRTQCKKNRNFAINFAKGPCRGKLSKFFFNYLANRNLTQFY